MESPVSAKAFIPAGDPGTAQQQVYKTASHIMHAHDAKDWP
jgi:hypothetical protein